ncbi:hypothetical protein [Sinorhizobium medicae]|jgi:hypothetical protein|uniref:hypothetical protein n=1 Tax=Sinorhizobium medicae TaxID=110321 RepID=UPI001294D0F3|nr:hypothetical protein [Sinorhizobium medicae]MQX78120.1 hypothetical protein [Sinorhizobium medicae]
MLLLRILTLPIALLTFSALYSASIKVPQLVETGSLILWIVFPVTVIVAMIKRTRLTATKG